MKNKREFNEYRHEDYLQVNQSQYEDQLRPDPILIPIHINEELRQQLRRQYPCTVDEAVEWLLRLIPDSEQDLIRATMLEHKTFSFTDSVRGCIDTTHHFTLGMWIRNEFGLWRGNLPLLNDTGYRHPDGASGVIIDVFFDRLRETDATKAYEPGEWRKNRTTFWGGEMKNEWDYVHVEPEQPIVKAKSFWEFSSRIAKTEIPK